ncbi:TrmH family RNA methyltransferase [Nonlabens marinus]|uniref:RNA methyltransferase, TrmH family n=1 Tax=Nonlabens marinus S1-08 TaxID=1454201 RepID=W8VVC1_9FLAO|nr:RNA methyltransferase [Nonlabens marinus]BAO55313.1 RNA methyltransferase, TrmH family [Nonlabens marinus S1-08]
MITKNKIKLIKSLARKKNRQQSHLFVVEGYKSIRELKNAGLGIQEIYVTQDAKELDDLEVIHISNKEMQTISNQTTAPGYLAVVETVTTSELPVEGLVIALDGIQDPGNLGTIIRLADWFNVKHLICNHGTVDLYNPKCVQATMGSIARVQVHYMDLKEFFSRTKLPVLVTEMEAPSLYDAQLPKNGILLLGNESNGVSAELLKSGSRISIPSYGEEQEATESLNVATATAIILAEWRRSIGK